MSETENLLKDKILQRMPHNLRTLEPLMEQNVEDFNLLLDERTPEVQKEEIRARLKIYLVELLGRNQNKPLPRRQRIGSLRRTRDQNRA